MAFNVASDALFLPERQSFLNNMMADFGPGRSWNDPCQPHNHSAPVVRLTRGVGPYDASRDRFEIDTEKFESFQGSHPERSLWCHVPICENARDFRGLGPITQSLRRKGSRFRTR